MFSELKVIFPQSVGYQDVTMLPASTNRTTKPATSTPGQVNLKTMIREAGSITWSGHTTILGTQTPVVAKMSYQHKRLETEAKLYCDKLATLQGVVVPRFYGLYQGAADDQQATSIQVMLLEHCGEPASALEETDIGLRCVFWPVPHQFF